MSHKEQNLETKTHYPWGHEHVYLGANQPANERRTQIVIGLTATMMVLEIASGLLFGSMALLADGWHMASHAAALAITALGYSLARRHAASPRFSFGTGKIGELAGYSSALLLAVIPGVLLIRSGPEVCLSIVQTVMVYMVDYFAFRKIHYNPMHPDGFGPDSALVSISRARRIETPSTFYDIPFIFCKGLVIFRVHDCEFAPRKGDSSKWIAVAQFSITQHKPYANPVNKFRQIYWYENLPHQSSKR